MVELRDRKEKAFILLRDASMQMSAVQLEASGDKCQSLYTKLIWSKMHTCILLITFIYESYNYNIQFQLFYDAKRNTNKKLHAR